MQITIPQDLYGWVVEQAKELSLPIASMVIVLVSEAKKNRENQKGMAAMFNQIGMMTPEELKKIMTLEGKEVSRALLE